ncbi:MAG: hypothetical protein AAF598_12255, partial [Bacteroidota bacterium]
WPESIEMHGKITRYRPFGTIQAVVNYSFGKQHGIKLTFHPNGNIEIRAEWKNGKPTGKWLYYDETNTLIKKIRFGKSNK